MKTRTKLGLYITLTWAAAFSLILYLRLDELTQLKPNELGDFLAGFAAPLGLLWIVLGYLQQGEELDQNTAALLAQQRELRSQVEETQQLVEAAKRQAVAAEHLARANEHERLNRRVADRASSLLELRILEASGNSQTCLVFTLENTGAIARRVHIYLNPPMPGEESPAVEGRVTPEFLDCIESGNRFELRILGPIVFPALVRFSYLSRTREHIEHEFALMGEHELNDLQDAQFVPWRDRLDDA